MFLMYDKKPMTILVESPSSITIYDDHWLHVAPSQYVTFISKVLEHWELLHIFISITWKFYISLSHKTFLAWSHAKRKLIDKYKRGLAPYSLCTFCYLALKGPLIGINKLLEASQLYYMNQKLTARPIIRFTKIRSIIK